MEDRMKEDFNNDQKMLDTQSNYSNVKYHIDVINSTSLPTSPSRDNIVTSRLPHIVGNSLSNSFDDISREPLVSEIEFLTTNENLSLKPQSSFSSNAHVTNQKRKKSNLFSNSNSYRSKMETFVKIFGDTEAINDPLLADFSCALVKNSHSILLQGRLYIAEKYICFYSKIISFENKIVLPISGITHISKEKTARVIPNALQIITGSGKYFFTSFGSREKTFNIISKLWQNYKNKKLLSSPEEKSIIQNCYGMEADIFINDDIIVDQLIDSTKLSYEKDVDEHVGLDTPNFVVGDDSDSDTEASVYSNNIDHAKETREKLLDSVRYRQKSRLNHVISDRNHENEFKNTIPILLQSLNVSNDVVHPLVRVYSHPNIGKAVASQSCLDHEHYQKMYLDDEIDMHIDKLFNCLFTNSCFFKRFSEYRKTFDVVQSSWPEDFTIAGSKERNIYYTLTLKAKIGPKISASEEKQIIYNNSQQGLFYMVDTEVRNSGFLLADCFHSVNRYCLIHLSGSKSRIKVSSQIVYDKSLFFASKSLIESTAKSGMADYFNDLGEALKHESRNPIHQTNINHSHVPPPSISEMKKSSTLQSQDYQHKSTIHINESIHSAFSDHFKPSSNNNTRSDRSWFFLIVLSLILCLCLSFLYSRFRQLEEITNLQMTRQHQTNYESAHDWKELLQHRYQQQLDELSQWKLLVDNSIDLIDQMKKVLLIIRNNLDKLTQEIKSNPVQFDGNSKDIKST